MSSSTKRPTPNEMWQTDFTYFKIIGLGLDVPVDDARRFLALHRRLEALRDDEGARCH